MSVCGNPHRGLCLGYVRPSLGGQGAVLVGHQTSLQHLTRGQARARAVGVRLIRTKDPSKSLMIHPSGRRRAIEE
jgi:hypothetical protein